MINVLPLQASQEEVFLPGTHESALRLALEGARQLAAQTRLLALNAAFESAGACRDAGVVEEMHALGRSAGQAAANADRITRSVELLLLQIQSSPLSPKAL